MLPQVLEAVLLPAGDPMWSPSSRQLALAQHPLDKDLGVRLLLLFLLLPACLADE